MVVAAGLGAVSPLMAQEGVAGQCRAAGAVHPHAPPQTAQFAFLVGRWAIEVRQPRPDGSWGGPVRKAYWEGRFILDGYAIADYWYDHPPDLEPTTHRGVNVRMFNAAEKRWDITWLHTEDPPMLLRGESRDGAMVLDGQAPDGGMVRIVFHDIGEDAWQWRMEASQDTGATWVTTMRIEARRLPCESD
jgi:hypothetical protein